MANSNSIHSVMKVMYRVEELLNAGLKLKELKNDLRVIKLEMSEGVPVHILVAVDRALRSVSNKIFSERVKDAIKTAYAALRVADQMDAIHAEALAYDATLCADEGCPQHGTPHQCVKLESVRADQVQAGDVLRVGNGENETVRGMIEGDNEIHFFWESGAVMRSAYPHTMVTRVVQS